MVPRARRRKMQPNLPMPYYEGATHHRVDGVDVYVDSPMRDLTQRTESVGRALDMFLNGVAFAALKHGYASRAQHARARREIAEFEADVRGLRAGAQGPDVRALERRVAGARRLFDLFAVPATNPPAAVVRARKAGKALDRLLRGPAHTRLAAGQSFADDDGAGGDYEYVKAVLEGVRREIEAAQIDRRDPVFLAVRDRYNQVLRESQSFFPRWLTDEDAARAGPPSPEPAPRQTALPRPDVPAGARPRAAPPRPAFPPAPRPAPPPPGLSAGRAAGAAAARVAPRRVDGQRPAGRLDGGADAARRHPPLTGRVARRARRAPPRAPRARRRRVGRGLARAGRAGARALRGAPGSPWKVKSVPFPTARQMSTNPYHAIAHDTPARLASEWAAWVVATPRGSVGLFQHAHMEAELEEFAHR